MAKNVNVEEISDVDLSLEIDATMPVSKTLELKHSKSSKDDDSKRTERYSQDVDIVSCLRNEKINVRYITKESGLVTNPKHVFYGGLAEGSVRIFTVPILESNGQYVNVLTNEEKAFLEDFMQLPYNALSVYKKTENYWDNFQVRLTKGETPLDLSNPSDYIKYKVLLANKDFIAPSIEALLDSPKATYQFVIVSEEEENKTSKNKLNATMQAYKEFGKFEDDYDTLRVIVETLTGRMTGTNTKLEYLQAQADRLIQADAKTFVRTITDPYLPTKVLIKRGIEAGIISKRGDYLYLKSDNSPLCEHNQDPTLSQAAKYLNMPKHQDVKFMIEAKLNN